LPDGDVVVLRKRCAAGPDTRSGVDRRGFRRIDPRAFTASNAERPPQQRSVDGAVSWLAGKVPIIADHEISKRCVTT